MNTIQESTSQLAPSAPVKDSLLRVADSAQLRYYARYFGDPLARLFWHDHELRIGIMPNHGEFFSQVIEYPIVRDLVAEGKLAEFAFVSQASLGFHSVYRLVHKPRITFWSEWSPGMWRAAALALVSLLRRLAEHGLTLRNPHPWNLLYDGRAFVYINPGSIVPLDPDTFARSYEKAARFFVRPLLLVENGYSHSARRLVEDPRDGVLAEDAKHVACDWAEWKLESGISGIAGFLQRLELCISCLTCESSAERWIDYFATDCDFTAGTSWSRKERALERILEDSRIQTVLDLGANTGHYARVAAKYGVEVIATDFDPALVDAIFEQSRDSKVAIYPAVMDFSHPAPGLGVTGTWFPPATERYKSDLVLCFALSHHMVFGKYRLDFEEIARGVRDFSKEWALVEYVERGKIRPAEWRADADSWYSVEEFASVLRRYFPAVQVLPPANDGRRLLVCGPERRLL
jgi:SAM-dependent methyltransferase